jgi:tetratricopeptide (TPR) repeat protein
MKRNLIGSGIIFAVTLVVYVVTLCPTFYWEDPAAFCAVHSLLGISHSPGFPLYVLLGRLATVTPVASAALNSNLMSAFWGSLALALLYILLVQILELTGSSRLLSSFAGAVSTLFFAFSTSFWLQTVRAEVYTLNLFLTLLLMFLALRWWRSRENEAGSRILLLFSFVLGLSLCNHPLLLVALTPALLFFFFTTDFKSLLSVKKLILLTAFVTLGLSVYLYLPIRSSLGPPINWGRPDSWSGLISYLLRTSQPSAPASESGMPYLNRFWFNLTFPVDQFRLPFFWLGVVGAISLFKSCRRILLLCISIFILNVLTATWATDFSTRNYDLLGYLLPSLSIFTIWFAIGLKVVLSWAYKEVRSLQAHPLGEVRKVAGYSAGYALFGLFLFLPALQAWKNFDRCNKRPQIWAYDYAHQILSSVKKDALILVDDDNTLTSLWCLNLAQGMRPDVKPVSVSALTVGSYREQISRQYGDVRLPDRGLRDFGEIAYRVSRLNAENLPVYCSHFFNHPEFVQYLRPAGYLFEFSPKKPILTDKDMEDQKSFLRTSLASEDFDILAREHFGNLLFNLGAFYDRSGGSSSSVEYFLWALDIDPANPRIYFQLGKAFLRSGDKARAQDFFQAGLELDPFNREAKKLLEQT